MSEKDFQFHIPVELIKAQKEDDAKDSWQVKGVASTDDADLQQETVDQNGLDISMLKAGRGLFNWDHHKGPENILGQIEDAEFITHDGKKALMVKGYLFKHQERAKAFYNILRSVKKSNGPRVHMSIEGKILERDFRNPKAINKARIEKVAFTLDPVNPYTYAELVKSLNAPDSQEMETVVDEKVMVGIEKIDLETLVDIAEKALSAGAGYSKPPTQMSSGESQTKESLESCVKNVTYGKKRKKSDKEMVKSVIDTARKAYPDRDPLDIAKWVLEAFLAKSNEGEGCVE